MKKQSIWRDDPPIDVAENEALKKAAGTGSRKAGTGSRKAPMVVSAETLGQWLDKTEAEARKIIPRATPQAQLNKALEELAELAELFKAESQNNLDGIKDGVGDVLVCLINYCALKDIDLVECLAGAYDEIKDRKGTLMEDGTFVKDQ